MHQANIDAGAQKPARRPLTLARDGVTLILLPGNAYDVRTRFERGAFGFAFAAQEGEDAFDGDSLRPFRRRPNTLSWLPPGSDVASRSPRGGEYLIVETADPTAGVASDAAQAARERRFSDAVAPPAIAAARAIRRTLLSGRAPDPLAVDAWLDTLRAALEQRLVGPSEEALAWLTPARLEHVDRLIERRMSEGPSVRELAAELGLSTGYFMRAFKRALGASPHTYVMGKRIERARRALESKEGSLAEIAHACGFTHQSHMTSVMRRELGVTPGAYRAAS